MKAAGFLKNKQAAQGLFILTLIIVLAVFVPMCSPYSYEEQNISKQNQGISRSHPFGTDKFGRDIFVRVFYGAQISLIVGGVSAGLNMIIATLYGAAAGYIGGRTDMVLMGIADIIYAVPSILYIILIMLVTDSALCGMILGICIAGWIETARVLRGEIRRLKSREFVLAAKLSGVPSHRILFRHLLPNASGQMIVSMTFLIPQAMFTESFLSFLGVGISAPAASLGTLLQEARSQIGVAPMQMVYPILLLGLIVISLNFIGAGLLEAVDPKQGREEVL